jgi:hypothetical protein
MKKLLLSAALYCVAFSIPITSYTYSEEAVRKTYKQQQDFVVGLLKHCKDRLPKIVRLSARSKAAAQTSIDTLSDFLNKNPESLECVIDTFHQCLTEKCVDIPTNVDACIKNYQAKMYGSDYSSFPDSQQVQQKLSALVICYFNFQLSPLGTVDHYAQDYLQRTNIDTYISLVTPFFAFVGIYALLHYGISHLSQNYTIVKNEPLNKSHVEHPILPEIRNSFLKEISSPAFKAIAAGFFTPDLQSSIIRTKKYMTENLQKGYAGLINKTRKTGYPTKPSKESFKAVKGYEDTKLQLTPLIDFCAHLIEYRATDLKIARGYLFEGNLAEGRKMAQALAGEIKWNIYEMHGSALVDKKLDKVLDDCLEFGPTVLIINNIDWIYTQKDVEPEVYSHVINKLTRYLSIESNYPIIVCATSQDHTVIDPVMLEPSKFELARLI